MEAHLVTRTGRGASSARLRLSLQRYGRPLREEA